MRFSKSTRVLIILGILFFSTTFPLSGINGYRQFLEVRNNTDVAVTVALLHSSDDPSGVQRLITVSPGTWGRVMGVIPYGRHDFEVEYHTANASIPERVDGIYVNNYADKTFLIGKRFVVSQTGGTKVFNISILRGEWKFYRLQRGSPKLVGTMLLEPYKYEIRGKWGQGTDMSDTLPISGEFNYPSLTFQINQYRTGYQVKYILQVSHDFDKWEGIQEIHYVDEGEEKYNTENVVITVDPVRMTVLKN